jgi:hypothetical protein
MSLVTSNQGEGIALEYLINKGSPSNLVLRLYTNNLTPGETDTEATFTEASGSGYSAITLTGASWTVTTGAPSEAAYAQQEFTFSGALGNVYGYYYTRAGDSKQIIGERFSDGPYNITASGQKIRITPKITAA